MPKPIEATNDFVVKFANTNGSGSASANELFARAILRMGVPIAVRNIFPSNIQGLPTWYEVRVSGEGWIGRRGGVDLMVPMNGQTWDKDVKEVEPGGYLFYDSSKPMPPSKFRADINIIGMPLTEMANTRYDIPRDRQLLKNVIYIGALGELLDMDHEELVKRVKRSDKVGDRIFIAGNDAAALGAVYGGATVAAWYPITPSTSVAEAFAAHCKRLRIDPETKKNRFAIIQSEDELSAIGSVIGASWNGARAFTATSGPGISLMQEFLGLAYSAEIPAVIFDIQRGGPSTGMPTRTQQSDLTLCAYSSHGDTKHVMIFPEDPHEAFEFGALSFDLADRLQTPIFVMLDLDIGMNDWLVKPLTWDDAREYDRGKVVTFEELEAGKEFWRYMDVDGDAVCYRTIPGVHPTKGAYFTRGSSRNKYAKYSEEGSDYVENMQRLLRKFETAKKYVPGPVIRQAKQGSRYGVIYFGSTSAAMDEALDALEKQGIHLDTMRIRAFPFADSVMDFVNSHEQVFVIEQNRDAQMRMLLVNEGAIDPARFISILHYDGTPITARFITREIAERLKAFGKPAPRTKVAS